MNYELRPQVLIVKGFPQWEKIFRHEIERSFEEHRQQVTILTANTPEKLTESITRPYRAVLTCGLMQDTDGPTEIWRKVVSDAQSKRVRVGVITSDDSILEEATGKGLLVINKLDYGDESRRTSFMDSLLLELINYQYGFGSYPQGYHCVLCLFNGTNGCPIPNPNQAYACAKFSRNPKIVSDYKKT